MAQNYGLGRGLSSLIPQKKQTINETGLSTEDAGARINQPREDFNYFGSASGGKMSKKEDEISSKEDAPKNAVQEVEISKIVPNPHQPRVEFVKERLQELADSIKEYGIIQPLVVTKNENGYELIAGERRLQAGKLAGLKTVPVIVREASERHKFELAIIENVQRHDLSLIEEAMSYKKLSEEFDLSQEEIAKRIGKSRSVVANRIRLLSLPIEIQRALNEGKINEGHAKLLLAIPNSEKQRAFFEMILRDKLTVRQTEDKSKQISVKTHKRNIIIDPETRGLEDELSGFLGTKVKIKKSGSGGQIVIEYYAKEELDNILSKIK